MRNSCPYTICTESTNTYKSTDIYIYIYVCENQKQTDYVHSIHITTNDSTHTKEISNEPS